MSLIFVLAKVAEKSSQEIKLKEYRTNKGFMVSHSLPDDKFKAENLYFFKLIEPVESTDNHVLSEVLTLKELSEQKNLPTVEDALLYTRMLTSIERLKSRAESPFYPKWDSGNQLKANRYLKELKDKGIDVSESETQFNELLSKKKQVQLEERKQRIIKLLDRLEELTVKHKWSDKAVEECLKELRALKNKEVAEPLESRLNSIEEKIMSDEVFLTQQREKISERIDDKILKLENSLLYGKWDKIARKQINDVWEKVEKFKLDNKYRPKIAELDAKNELLKQGKLSNPFSDEEKRTIVSIDRIVNFSMMRDLIDKKQGNRSEASFYFEEMVSQSVAKRKEQLLELKNKYPHNHDQFCLELVKRAHLAVLLLDEPTEESCLIALEREIELFQFLENKTDAICLHVLRKDGMLLEHIEEQTPEMCMIALEQNPNSIAFFKM